MIAIPSESVKNAWLTANGIAVPAFENSAPRSGERKYS